MTVLEMKIFLAISMIMMVRAFWKNRYGDFVENIGMSFVFGILMSCICAFFYYGFLFIIN